MTSQWTVDVIACRGSSYDVGKQMAVGFRKTARGRAFKRRKERRPPGFSLKNAEHALQTWAPNIWEELHGLADGLEISLERAAAEFSNGRLRYPARGCSAVLSHGIFGRNYDFNIRRYDRILAAIQPKGVNASIGFTDRFTGRDDGMNEHGLCVGLHYVNDRIWQPGLVCILIVRIVLDQCATTSEAIDLLQRLPHGLGFNYSLMDAKTDAAVVEACPKGIAVRRGSQLACTNHFQSPELRGYNRSNSGSHRRLPPLETWAGAKPGMEELFGHLNESRSPVFDHDYAGAGGTLHTLACRPSTGDMLIGIGGDASPARFEIKHWARGADLPETTLAGQLGGTHKPFDPKRRVREPSPATKSTVQKQFVGTDLAGASFENLTLKGARFDNIDLAGARFDDINFAGADISRNCNFRGMTIAGVSIEDLFAAYRTGGNRDET